MMRVYYIPREQWLESMTPGSLRGTRLWESLCEQAHALGFDTVLTCPLDSGAGEGEAADVQNTGLGSETSLTEALTSAAAICGRHDLRFFADFSPSSTGQSSVAECADIVSTWLGAGVEGIRCRELGTRPASDWAELISKVHDRHPDAVFWAWTPGLTPDQLQALHDCGFAATFLSLPWWDYHSPWLIDEHERLRRLGPVICPAQNPDDGRPGADADGIANAEQARRRLWSAALAGDGILMVSGFEELAGHTAVQEVNHRIAGRTEAPQRLRWLSGPLSSVTAIFRAGEVGRLLLLNPSETKPAKVDRHALCSRLPGRYAIPSGAHSELPEALPPGGYTLVNVGTGRPVTAPAGVAAANRKAGANPPLDAPRVAIENIKPSVDGGMFPAKRSVGETVVVEADVFMDGHERIAVELLWRSLDETQWRRVPMTPLGNDRWQSEFTPDRIGRHWYTVQAWWDVWQSYRSGLQKKFDAKQDVSLEVEEGRMLMVDALTRIGDDMPAAAELLAALLRRVGRPSGPKLKPGRTQVSTGAFLQHIEGHPIPAADDTQIGIMLSADTAELMRAVDGHPFETTHDSLPLTVDRREARFASWYELFPRSLSATAGSHGTFQDVIKRLPAIRDMGFDVLYMTPIHPIGTANRKGRNNALAAGADDPGSPYAIGSSAGGHDAVHPELGSLDDFREMVAATRALGMEVALDFAVQCSPDHPWLTEHPDWFDWRADGSLRHAENPPKRYEDIVNPDFYNPQASVSRRAALWRALRDVVLFWVEQDVRIFRVDNPHTKPLPFWQWLISQVQSAYPDVVFLSEAFTRPKMMYRLAKIGFTQSYTYFTWRNTKQELAEYFTELNTAPVAEFFRPNFFVNTPDINPYFLQTSGRPGFLIRAAIAATTSGLWGMYSGFELCEAASLPGREEYLDSEKYEFRRRDWAAAGNIVREITRLNHIRRNNPALQSHLGLRIEYVDNDQILFFSKTSLEGDSMVLVAISLDPKARQAGTLVLPPPPSVLPTSDTLHIHELFDDGHFVVQGGRRYVELSPERPFLLWAIVPPG